MRWEYHVAAVGGEASDVAVDLVDVLNTLGAQGWELAAALPPREHAGFDRATAGRRDARR
jgi:hypothetical protein